MMDESRAGTPGPTAQEVRAFVYSWLTARQTLPAGQALDSLAYLDEGYVSSMDFVAFVLALEERFAMRFADGDFVAPEARTVGGLIDLVLRRAAPGGAQGD